MRREALLALLVFLVGAHAPAHADLAGQPAARPTFSTNEAQTIARNDILSTIIDRDPWLVREILDGLAKGSSPQGRLTPPPDGIDPVRNPDLKATPRDTEASLEWLELLRKARNEASGKSAEPPMSSRSAEGALETLELLRNAGKGTPARSTGSK